MPSLTEEQWLALRAEWETGIHSNRKLAEKWGVSETLIRRKRDDQGWTRDSRTPRTIRERARKVVEEHVRANTDEGVRTEGSQDANITSEQDNVFAFPVRANTVANTLPPPKDRSRPELRRPKVELPEDVRERIADQAKVVAVETAISNIAEATIKQLEDAAMVRAVVRRYGELVQAILSGDEHAANQAAGRILASDKETLSSAISTLIRAAEGAQKIERQALGIEERKQVSVKLNEAPGGVVRQEAGQTVIDPSQLPDEQLIALQGLLEIVDGQTKTELPLPPRGPVIEHDPEEGR